MKYTSIILSFLFCFAFLNVNAQVVWTGSKVTFTKQDNADWTLEENQDRITDNVWITRANNQGIFNIRTEAAYVDFGSPGGTLWAFGTTADIPNLNFVPWETMLDNALLMTPQMIGRDIVVFLVVDEIYIDLKFTSWTSMSMGGGFSYERSSDPLNNNKFLSQDNDIQIFPNPSSDFISIKNLSSTTTYKLYDQMGKLIKESNISPGDIIDIQYLSHGQYVLGLANGSRSSFIKN